MREMLAGGLPRHSISGRNDDPLRSTFANNSDPALPGPGKERGESGALQFEGQSIKLVFMVVLSFEVKSFREVKHRGIFF